MSAVTVNAPSSCLLPMVGSSLTSATPVNRGKEVTGHAGGMEKKNINPELWQACAGPLISLPTAGTLVYYFPQGHSEQVAASMKKNSDAQIPSYPNLPSKLLCLLHNVTLHADAETDDVYAQMTLQPVPSYDREALLRSDLSLKANKPQSEAFCKTLTASDTSTHGGFSVPRRAAEKIFPPLDFAMTPPAQELVAKDLHDSAWTFRHIYRGQPKRHLLTTGWSLFVSGKRLFAGDSVLFIRDEKQQLLLGIRRSNRQSSNLSSSVLSSDSMHIGILAAAAHAAANNSPFTVYYNPRASPSEFVVPLAKYYKAMYSNQVSLGMRFRMMLETEDSGTRRFMGTITGISDLDPQRWQNSQWRNLQVGWDESTAGERRNRVSIWEIEPVTGPFFLCPPFFRPKRPRPAEDENVPWMGDEIGMKDPTALSGLGLMQWMNMQQNSPLSTLSSQMGYRMNRQLPQIDQSAALQAQVLQQQLLAQQPPVQLPINNPPHENQLPTHLLQKLQQQVHQTQSFPSRIGMQGQSIITEEGPSCSTSPSVTNNRFISQPIANVPNPEIPPKPLNQEFPSPLTYLMGGHVDYIDTSSSTTSEVNLQNMNPLPFSQPQASVRVSDEEFPGNMTQEDIDLSSSLISQSQQFPLPDPSFAPLSDNVLNNPTWASVPIQRVRTFKKVYKRGAVGRSVDITAYSGYDELKRDLARRFGIEGQLEDRQRVGWKLVYVDHENDILLVGDDPWEEFVNCVKCIKILSPQEVQQMSLDGGDPAASALPNHACSSSDN